MRRDISLGSHIFWLFSALLFHVVRNLACHFKVFFSNVGTPSYREFYKMSLFYLTVCPSVCHFDIFLRNCSLVFSSKSLFKKSSYFWWVLNIFENLKNFELHSPLPCRLQSIYKMLTGNEHTNDF